MELNAKHWTSMSASWSAELRFAIPASLACQVSTTGKFISDTSMATPECLNNSTGLEIPLAACAKPCLQMTGPELRQRCSKPIQTAGVWPQPSRHRKWTCSSKRLWQMAPRQQKYVAPAAEVVSPSFVLPEDERRWSER